MQHLTPVGLSQDGRELVLVSDSGEEYSVQVDHRFRAALRGDNARLGRLEMKMESALRPRDIQARIRAGESAEDVAAAAQTTVDAIMAFAGPVLAERAHIAQTALKASIRRRSHETTPGARTLDEASRNHFSSVGVRADDVAWDAWRRDDGRWTLVAAYALRGTEYRATLTYDQPGRYVVAEDEGARLLTGEAAPVTTASDEAPRRLSAVPAEADELPLGDDAIELVRGPQPVEPEPLVEEPTETTDLTETATAVRDAARPDPTFDDLALDHADADWMTDAADAPVDVEPASEAAPDRQPEHDVEPETAQESAPEPPHEPEPDAAPGPAPEPGTAAQEKPKKKGRSSVPSWDEIMFGGGGRD